jgi:hypothetical protein
MDAQSLTRALGGKWTGKHGMARCPAHKDRTPSLSVAETDVSTVLLKCFAGCSQDAVIDALRHRGLWEHDRRYPARRPQRLSSQNNNVILPRQGAAKPSAKALAIWKSSQPITGTLAESYLIARGITPPDPSPLKFHPALDYFDTAAPGGPVKLPAMVAAVQSVAGNMTAIQRTYIDPRGDRKAQVATPKKTLGTVTGGAVRLAAAAPTLALCEGVEDALALAQMTGQAAWAVLGASNFRNFQPLPVTQKIVLAPDADLAGDKAVAEAAERFAELGLKVLHLRPPEGCDWCDLLGDYEERAALREFDGGDDRAEAELQAFAEVVGGRLAHA